MIKEGPDNKRLQKQLKSIKRNVKKGQKLAAHEVGSENVRYMRNLLLLPKTGRQYPFEGGVHIASAPGEAPANKTGVLFTNMDYAVHGSEILEFGDKTVPGRAPVGRYLELGTVSIEPRSHVLKTAKDRQKEAHNTLGRIVKEELVT